MTALDKSILNVWRIKSGLWAGVLSTGVLIWDIMNFFEADRITLFGLIPAAVMLFL